MSEAYEEFWSAHQLVIEAVPAQGPHQGAVVAAVTPREKFMEELGMIGGLTEEDRQRLVQSVLTAVLDALAGPASGLTDPKLMDDLSILMTCKLIYGEQVVTAAGLSQLVFAVSPRENDEWSRRGMLDPEFMGSFGDGGEPAPLS
jgi:hypothetical protein